MAESAAQSGGFSPPSPCYSCGYCPSGPHSADMSKPELIKHLALVHNVVILTRKSGPLAIAQV